MGGNPVLAVVARCLLKYWWVCNMSFFVTVIVPLVCVLWFYSLLGQSKKAIEEPKPIFDARFCVRDRPEGGLFIYAEVPR